MSTKLIFVDVDDTLFDKKALNIPASAINALQTAQKNGHKIFVNTGRPYSYLEKEIKAIGFDGYLCSNGLDIHVGEEHIFHKELPKEVGLELRDLARKHKLVGSLQGTGCVYFPNEDHEVHDYYASLLDDFNRSPYMPHAFTWDNVDIYEKGIFFAGKESDMPGFIEAVKAMDFDFDCCRINDGQYEILTSGHHKGTAIQYVANYFGLTTDDCCAIGDSNNDTEMLQSCGIGIAMGNACDELKEKADYVTTDIDQDGIYNALKHYRFI
jgi:Cof subfamily protein (haloacid dehalogenase superfamily)